MKKSIYFLPAALLVLASCGGNSEPSVESLIAQGNLEALKVHRKEIVEQQATLTASLKQLDSAIEAREGVGKIPLVSTLKVEPSRFEHFLELQGDVQTKQNILLYPEMPGTLIKVFVKEGDLVRQGQVLARIDDGGMASGLEQLRTQAALAETTFERQKRLWEQNIGSEIQYLQAKTNYEATVNSVKQAEAQLAKATIRAPFGGIIDDVMLDEGSTVNPATGMPAFRLVNLGNMYVAIDVPESYLESVRPGKEVQIYLPVLGDSIQTRVRQAGNYINPTNRSFSVEVPVPNQNGRVKPNLTARVRINDYTNENALLIPPTVISENAEGEQYVYVAVEINESRIGKAQKRVITTGKSQGNDVEVLSGIEPGEQIITEGARRIREGQDIEISEGI